MVVREQRLGPAVVCLMALLVSGCGSTRPAIAVGARNVTEQALLGEILVQHLTRRLPGETIVRRFGITSTMLAHETLVAGELDVYPEYTGAALTAILKLDPQSNRASVRELVRDNYRLHHHCEWFGPLGFENSFALVISAETASRESVRNLSQAADYGRGWALSVSREFQERSDGLPLMMRHYRLRLTAPLRALEPNLIYPSLTHGDSTMIATSSTDSELENPSFAVLADDKGAFPPYEAGFVARTASLQAHPGLAEALRALEGKIPLSQMRAMNRRVEHGKIAPELVAAEFLKGAGL